MMRTVLERMWPRAMRWRVTTGMVTIAVIVSSVPVVRAGAQPAPPPVSRLVEASPYAWDISLALETMGDLRGALDVMIASYGVLPAVYAPCVRVAWLRLQLGEYDESEMVYRRAMTLEPTQPEARSGLALALTGTGFRALDRGDFPTSRVAWTAALELDPLQRDARRGIGLVGRTDEIAPEAWIGRVSATQNSSSTSVMYAQLPVRFTSWFSARAAVRRVGAPTTASTTAQPFLGSQTELYGAVQLEHGRTATDIAGFRLNNILESNTGGAVRMRVGGRQGVALLGSWIQQTGGANAQLAPTVFRWVTPTLRLSVGSRYTSDSAFTGVSGLAGATWVGKEATVDVRMHAGKERWAFDMAGPSILSFQAETSGGGVVTASVPFNDELTVNVQAQMERTLSPTLGAGRYTGFSLGVRYAPTTRNR